MRTIEELKKKWFIDVADREAFPPQNRFSGSKINSSTDGNYVEPLIDGKAVMSEFYFRLQEMINSGKADECRVFLASMGIDPVKVLGETGDADSITTEMLNAAEQGVKINYLGSGQSDIGPKSKKFSEELIEKGSDGAADKRFPGLLGGHHQKFNLTYEPKSGWQGIVSSADFFFARWDTPDHSGVNPDRKSDPTHDLGVKIKGPAAKDLAISFMERWNDEESWKKTSPQITKKIPEDILDKGFDKQGTCSVQVLRTYPVMKKDGFSWSAEGEFTIWAAYIKALKEAEKYIYIEDQYLYSFGNPIAVEKATGKKLESDIVYQLGEALKRGVDLVALVPGRSGSILKHYESQHRRNAMSYLDNITKEFDNTGRFVLTYTNKDSFDPTIHSKLLLVDDEFAMIGSANVCQRSIAYITELNVSIVDAENDFVKNLRLDLWKEHMELEDSKIIDDWYNAVGEFVKEADDGNGRLKNYPKTKMKPQVPYGFIMNKIVDPYCGPSRD